MANLKNAVPSSLRKQVESSQFAYNLMARSLKAAKPSETSDPGIHARLVTTGKSRFLLLPEETEDARITGLTRSLTRRLMALNMPKMDVSKVMLPVARGKLA